MKNKMKFDLTANHIAVKSLVLCLLIFGMTACKKNKTTPEPPAQADVVVTGISNTKLKGLATVTISGSGFSTTLKNNKVTFNGIEAIVTAATGTSLTVTVPVKAGSGKVKVQVGDKVGIGPDYEYEFVYMVNTLAGKAGEFGFKDGTGSVARFSDQFIGLRFGADGNLYLAEQGSQRIRKITAEGVVSTFAGSTQGLKEGGVLTAQFSDVYDITPSLNGAIYVTDASNARVRKISAGLVSTFAGSTLGYIDGQGSSAQFNSPVYICSDANGNLYVSDDGNHKIRKITVGGSVSTFAGSTDGYQDGIGNSAKFADRLGGLAVDSKGNVFVSDTFNQCIRKITPEGTVSTYIGLKGVSSSIDGSLTTARTVGPGYLSFDANDNIYFVDAYRIRKISADGIVSTIAGTGKEGSNDGPIADAQFKSIGGLAVTQDGKTIYVGDNGLGTIRKIELQ